MLGTTIGWYPGATRSVSVAVLALLLAFTTTLPAAEAEAAAEEPAAEGRANPLFTKLHPDFIVNLRGSGGHYLMATIEVKTRSQTDVDNAQRHLPALRHHLLLMMGELGYRDALTPEGRNKLSEDALSIVQRVLDEEAGSNAVEAVLFTGYLVE